jgi:mono/diheme cytochrome c family protein/glucose/arabinose dehydrogenase
MTTVSYKLGFLFSILITAGCNTPEKEVNEQPPVKRAVEPNPSPAFLSPEESFRSFHLPEGYTLELVADESILNEPVAIAWDGNGRMFVAEMCTYMQDVDGSGTMQPQGKILLLDDTDGDGKMDKHSVYIDSLVLPRMILPLDDRLLVNETYTYDLWSYRDSNGDGVADEKERLYHQDQTDKRNLEHQASGLIWNVDNWIYNSRNPVRFKFKENKIQVDSLLDAPIGQWGLTHDDFGRLYYSSAGGEIAALGFQQNPAYGSFELEDQLLDDFDAVWPIIATPDVQGGAERLRLDSTLNHFTASCGQVIYQGDRLPKALRGDLFICEPVGRLIRRAKVINRDGQIFLKNAYHKNEFLTSTDMNFRPVNMATGPDGCLYIVDMYRGIIQESNWTREGSYLRPVIKRMKLDMNFGRGRIYRLVHEDDKPGPRPKMLDESTEQLLQYLSHPNGWWRSTAQKLIILRNDKSVVGELEKMAVGRYNWFERIFSQHEFDPSSLTRLHALWTLKGLDALEKGVLLEAFRDEDAQVRKTAIWASEDHLAKNDADVFGALQSMKNDSSGDVHIQLVLSLRYSNSKQANELLEEMKKNYPDNVLLQTLASASLKRDAESEDVKKLKTKIAGKSPYQRKLIVNGAGIFKQLCATCHGVDGKGMLNKENKMLAPPLDGSQRVAGDRAVLARIVLHGLSGPVDGKTYPDVMPAMEANDDEWIASVLSYVRFAFGDDASIVRAEHVHDVREETKGRKKYWTMKELEGVK